MIHIYRFILLLLFSGVLTTGASAYIINISAPDSQYVGSPLVITGSTTFPEDTYFDLVLFYSKYTSGEVKRQKVIVDKSKLFRSEFETRNLEKGQYKIEVHNIVSDGKQFVESSLGSSSVTRRVIQLIDRSDEITIESPVTQNISAALMVNGYVKDQKKRVKEEGNRVKEQGGGVLTVRVFGPDDFTFGPQQLITTAGFADDYGHFSTLIPITSPGEYQVSFSDKTGFIGEFPFNVTDSGNQKAEQIVVTPLPTTTELPSPPVTPVSTPPTPSPTPTKSPLPVGISILGILAGYYLCKKER